MKNFNNNNSIKALFSYKNPEKQKKDIYRKTGIYV